MDSEECRNCKATRWEHSPEQWEYCQQSLALALLQAEVVTEVIQ